MTGQVVRGDRPDPIRAIYLTKWLVKASYTDENEEISLVIKKNGSLTRGSADGFFTVLRTNNLPLSAMINPAELWGPESARLLKLNSSPLQTAGDTLKGLSLCAVSACRGLICIAGCVNAAVYRFVAPLATDIACVPTHW